MDWRAIGGLRRFNHKLTGYALEGVHKPLNCKKCHTARFKKSRNIKFIGLKKKCINCHKDSHNFKKSKYKEKLLECTTCHGSDGRSIRKARGLKFNHAKIASFPLRGKHQDTKCTNCHQSTKVFKIKPRPKDCIDCHRDVHKNVYTIKKRDCIDCHSDKKRKFSARGLIFKHKKETGFALKGKHRKITCKKCHAKKQRRAPKAKCITCHSNQSAHVLKGKDRFNGRDCIDCHNSQNFKKTISFDHLKNTNFPLGGKHKTLSCKICHRITKTKKTARKVNELFEFFESASCVSCHAHKKEHKGQFNKRPKICVKCHVAGRKNITNPSHVELTPNFKQQGAHKKIKCIKCHGKALKVLKPGKDCIACHQEQDVHERTLGKRCAKCHVEGYPWNRTKFDHKQQSSWPLEGKHVQVACKKCHSNAPKLFKPTPVDCIECHKGQDIHRGALGSDCKKCHDVNGTSAFFNHSTMTKYPLVGAHAKADCRGCHAASKDGALVKVDNSVVLDMQFKSPGNSCRDCHGDPHGLRKGASCKGCHSTTEFIHARQKITGGEEKMPVSSSLLLKEIDSHQPQNLKDSKTFDPYHERSPFSLRDQHVKIDCVSCHGGRGDLQGQGVNCASCHQNEDVHMGSLGMKCADCHSQKSFAISKFSHASTGFSLAGAHRMLACNQCHSAGNYQGISTDCVSCHMDDALRAKAVDHVSTSYIGRSCIQCHNQNAWPTSLLRRRFAR